MLSRAQSPENNGAANRPLTYLFIDFNAYFAGVEQHDHPELMGKPVIVTPLASEHTGAIAVNLIGWGIIWKAFDRDFADGLVGALLGIAGAELRIWTAPKEAILDWDEYQQKYKVSYKKGARNWQLTTTGNSLFLTFNF